MDVDTKKLINQKKYTMKDKKIREIKKEWQENQRSRLNESEGEQLEQSCTMNGAHKYIKRKN